MFRSELVVAVLALGASLPVLAADYGLGRAATPAEVQEWNIDVRPDGQGLPVGHGSVSEGETVYEDKCASCHGFFGESQSYMALAGGIGSLKSGSPVRTVGSKLNYATTLWDYIHRAMPFTAPKTLTVDETYAVAAYVLNLNGILPDDAVLDQDSLPKVQMPNRDGYTRDHGMGTIDGKPDTHNTACMKKCEKSVTVTSELPENFTKQLYGDISDNFRHYDVASAGAAVATDAAPTVASKAVPSALKLAQHYGCTGCHAPDHKIIGPAFRDVAKHYAGQEGALTQLMAKVAAGGAGNWGNIPMPAQSQVPDNDRKTLIEWILAGAKE